MLGVLPRSCREGSKMGRTSGAAPARGAAKERGGETRGAPPENPARGGGRRGRPPPGRGGAGGARGEGEGREARAGPPPPRGRGARGGQSPPPLASDAVGNRPRAH